MRLPAAQVSGGLVAVCHLHRPQLDCLPLCLAPPLQAPRPVSQRDPHAHSQPHSPQTQPSPGALTQHRSRSPRCRTRWNRPWSRHSRSRPTRPGASWGVHWRTLHQSHLQVRALPQLKHRRQRRRNHENLCRPLRPLGRQCQGSEAVATRLTERCHRLGGSRVQMNRCRQQTHRPQAPHLMPLEPRPQAVVPGDLPERVMRARSGDRVKPSGQTWATPACCSPGGCPPRALQEPFPPEALTRCPQRTLPHTHGR